MAAGGFGLLSQDTPQGGASDAQMKGGLCPIPAALMKHLKGGLFGDLL